MISKRTYLAAAALIALAAFATGQAFPGMGVPFLVLASTLWVAWTVRRGGRRGLR
ncbi:MAG TPA: hypothetical protein VGB57_06900 [Allosphingosinicella sp.]